MIRAAIARSLLSSTLDHVGDPHLSRLSRPCAALRYSLSRLSHEDPDLLQQPVPAGRVDVVPNVVGQLTLHHFPLRVESSVDDNGDPHASFRSNQATDALLEPPNHRSEGLGIQPRLFSSHPWIRGSV